LQFGNSAAADNLTLSQPSEKQGFSEGNPAADEEETVPQNNVFEQFCRAASSDHERVMNGSTCRRTAQPMQTRSGQGGLAADQRVPKGFAATLPQAKRAGLPVRFSGTAELTVR